MPSTWRQHRKAQQRIGANWDEEIAKKNRPKTARKAKLRRYITEDDDFDEQIEAATVAAESEVPKENFKKISYLREGELDERLDKFAFLDKYEHDRDALLKDPKAPIPMARQHSLYKMDKLLGVEPCSRPSSMIHTATAKSFSSHAAYEAPLRTKSFFSKAIAKMDKLEHEGIRNGKWKYAPETGFEFEEKSSTYAKKENKHKEALPDANSFMRRVEALAPGSWEPNPDHINKVCRLDFSCNHAHMQHSVD